MPADREHMNETDRDPSLPIADIDRSDVKAAAAENVRGGAAADPKAGKVHTSDLVVTKHTDSSSPS